MSDQAPQEDAPSWDADAGDDVSQNSGAEESSQTDQQADVAQLTQLMHRGNTFLRS